MIRLACKIPIRRRFSNKIILNSNKLNGKIKPKLQKDHKLNKQMSVLLYPEGLITLNASACEILNICNGDNTINDIKNIIYNKYKIIDELQLSNEIDRLLEDAYFKNWIILLN